MAATPLTSVALGATSVTDDLGYVALTDLSRALAGVADDYRVIGGHMVTMLAARWQLGAGLYRETGDVDLGIPPVIARDHRVASRLRGIDYIQVAGNRFARSLSDIPIEVPDIASTPTALIDVLVPAYTSRARENVQVGDDLFRTEVLGLQLALARPPVTMTLNLRRLNGQALHCQIPFADEVSALVLKGLATTVRFKDTDITDIWRCLEIAFAAGLGSADFDRGTKAEGAAVVRGLFASRHGGPMAALAAQQHLSSDVADERYTRIRALIARVLGA
jgi:hypothetical protein